MTENEMRKLARTYAEVRGYSSRPGGWIYAPNGRPITHGWTAFAHHLRDRGRIRNGQINWMADHR